MAIDSLELNRDMLRLSGLSSGMDTGYVIEGMMMIDQARVDKQNMLKTELEWKEEAYRDINLSLRNFREQTMSVLSPDTNMYTASAYSAYSVTMLDSSSAVSIGANYDAVAGNITINSITQLATTAEVKSIGITTGDDLVMGDTLADLDLATALTFESGEISFSINGEVFTFSETTELNDMITTINANGDAGVQMSYSSLTKGFTFRANGTGTDSEVAIVNITGNAFADVDAAFGIAQGTVNGQDAVLRIEGIDVTQSSNTFSIDGISYTLKDTSASSISFNIERNVEDTVDRIKAFIDSYNTLIEELQIKLEEPEYRTYDPLTDEQKEALSEKEIEQWEEMAKSGLMRNDSYLTNLLNTLRSSFYTEVGETGKTLADLGLRTGSYRDGGKILIDESTLRAAVESNPQEVSNMFINKSSSDDEATAFGENGLITRISTAMLSYVDNTTSVALKAIATKIDNTDDRIETLVDAMDIREEALWKRFTAMEKMLSTLNNQSSWLASQISAISPQ